MISEGTKDLAWNELLELDYHVRYYRALSDLHQKKHSFVQFVVFFLSLSIPLIGASWNFWTLPASLAVAACVAWDYMNAHASKAAVLDAISADCEKLLPKQLDLFNLVNYDLIEEPEARQTLNELSRLSIEATSRAGVARITVNEKLNIKCWNDSNTVLLREQQEVQNV